MPSTEKDVNILLGAHIMGHSFGKRIGWAAAAFGLFLTSTASAQEDNTRGGNPVYRSLGVDRAHMRTGPSLDYPIEWVLVRQGLPLEVLRRYGRWAQVKEPDGSMGWLKSDYLSTRRTAIVVERTRTIFADPKATALALYRVEAGASGEVISCADAWCKLDFDGKSGWIPRVHLWGTYTSEKIGG